MLRSAALPAIDERKIPNYDQFTFVTLTQAFVEDGIRPAREPELGTVERADSPDLQNRPATFLRMHFVSGGTGIGDCVIQLSCGSPHGIAICLSRATGRD